MEVLKRELRIQKLILVRQKAQIDEICKKKTIDIENLSKLEAFVSMYFNPSAAKITDIVNQILMSLNLEDADQKKDEEKLLSELVALADLGLNYQCKIRSFHAKLAAEKSQPLSPPTSSRQNSTTSSFLKLKEIEPPKFDGELIKFYEWQNLFTSLVHDNKDLTNVQKLYYLKNATIKDAEGILDDFGLSNEAYVQAWSYIVSHFSKKRSIVLAHFRTLKNLEPSKDEKGIQKLLDKTNGIIRGLKAAGEQVDNTFSRYLAFHVGTKLDVETFRDWENSLVSVDSYPTFDQLCEFLQNRAFAVDDREKQEKFSKSSKKNYNLKEPKSYATFRVLQCPSCSKSHYLSQCSEFLRKSPPDRFEFVKKNRLCLICFKSNHTANDCTSRYACGCGSRHSSLLHFEFKSPKEPSIVRDNDSKKVVAKNSSSTDTFESPKSYLSRFGTCDKFIMLPTALVKFVCGNIFGTCRVLLDSCSQPNMISDRFVRKFNLPISSIDVGKSVQGVSFSPMQASQSVTLTIASKLNSYQLEISGNVVPAPAMSYSTHIEVSLRAIEKLRGFQLADPAFINSKVVVPHIDMIIGREHYEKIVCNDKRSFDSETWFVRLTQFGWVVSGVAPEENYVPRTKNFIECTLQEIDSNIRQFWEIEEATPVNKSLNAEANYCHEHFRDTYSSAPDGKFNTRSPFRINRSKVANNRKLAMASLLKTENKLDEDMKLKYVNFMPEYKLLGHMSLAEPTTDPHYFIPHHQVVRIESQITPVRIVFNASSSSKGNLSLNDALMIGPNLQRDLFDILISMELLLRILIEYM